MSEPQSYYWINKRVTPGSPQWTQHVHKNTVCPNQRLYRRLTRAERLLFYRDNQAVPAVSS